MDEVLKILHTQHGSSNISHACQVAVREIEQAQERNMMSWIEIDHAESCFMMVFLSNMKDLIVLPNIVKALTSLMKVHPPSKKRLGSKGILFNVKELLLLYKLGNNGNDEYLKCAYKLSIALLEDCPDNLMHAMASGLLSLIQYSFDNCFENKDVMTYCLQLLSILIVDSGKVEDEKVSKLKSLWRNQCYSDKGDLSYPTWYIILSSMNRFLQDSPKIQLYGISCLRSLTTVDGATQEFFDNGIVDTVTHAYSYYSEDENIPKEYFKLIKSIVENVSYEQLQFKVHHLSGVLSSAMKTFMQKSDVMLIVCSVLKSLLLVANDLGSFLLLHDLPSAAFYSMAYLYDAATTKPDEFNPSLYAALIECFYLIMSNSQDDIRNKVLLQACRKSQVGLAVCCLYLGANVNFSAGEEDTVLSTACKQRDDTMVKKIVGLMATFQHVGLWKARIENVVTSIKTSLKNQDHCITATLLWYLLDRDISGIAEWSNLELSKLRVEWLELAFPGNISKEDNNKSLVALRRSKWFELSACVLASSYILQTRSDNTKSLANLREIPFSVFGNNNDKKCPLQEVQALIDEKKLSLIFEMNEIVEDEEERMSAYGCPRCSHMTAYRDILKLSYDEETELAETFRRGPTVKCTCHVTFPPPNLTTVEVKTLQLAHNGLTSIKVFSDLSRTAKERLYKTVTKINLFDNKLTSFPCAVAQIFHGLVELLLSKNQLLRFPFEILKHIPNLEVLDLADNMIQDWSPFSDFSVCDGSLPPEERRKILENSLHNLKTLKLSSNSLVEFPSWILVIFPKLARLEMRKNLVKSLLDTDNLLVEMHSLFDVRPERASLLEHIDISQNKIIVFSTTCLHYFPNLRYFNLSQNKIEKIEVADLELLVSSKLKYLDMSKNCLSSVPPFIPELPKLETVLLSDNNICDFQLHIRWKTKRLKHLDIAKNQIDDPSLWIEVMAEQWPSTLKNLNLSQNYIQALPSCMGELRALETLDVSRNCLRVLPDQLGRLSSLTTFRINDNQLMLEESIINGRAQEIRQFLYARLKKSVPQNRVKLMLVGNPQAGKTTLLKSLMKSRRRPRTFSGSYRLSDVISGGDSFSQSTTLATIGVDVVEVPVKHGDRLLQLSVWDFAGQEDFYATHPCFMSERAMYIAMYDASKGPRQLHTLKPWLTAIHARATHCPVLIVGSHADLLPRNKEEITASLRRELQTMSKEKWFPRGASNCNSVYHEILDVRENSSGFASFKTAVIDIISGAIVHGHPLVGSHVPHSYVQLTELLKREAEKRSEFPVIRQRSAIRCIVAIFSAFTFPQSELYDFESLAIRALQYWMTLLEDSFGNNFNQLAALVRNDDAHSPQFDSGSELMMAVKYLHQTGVLLHFDEPRSRLRDCFFIKPAWLCKLLAQVVTMKHDNSYKINPYINNEGILSKTKFSSNFVLGKSKDNSLLNQFLPRLFRLLENFEVVLWQGGDRYLVPSKLSANKPDIELPDRAPGNLLIRHFSMAYTPMGLWPRLTARLLAFSDKILHGYSSSRFNDTAAPQLTRTWREGLYFEWGETTRNGKPFVLVQSGSEEFDRATADSSAQLDYADSPVDQFERVEWKSKAGLEVIVPRSPSGQILLAQLVDHVTSLVEEWYPGLLDLDELGRSFIQQYSPCFICCVMAQSSSEPVTSFCISDLAESVLCNKKSTFPSEEPAYEVRLSTSGVILVYCPRHRNTPVPLALLAPEINLDDFDSSLRLDPKLLYFEASSRQLLGGGGFGAVYQATYDGEDVAVKTFFPSTSDMSYKMLRAELNVLAQHRHPSIIALKGFIPPAFSTPSLPLPLLAIEFAKLGSLGKLLCSMGKLPIKARKSALSPQVRHRIALEIADGLCFLHRQDIVYRDLKPDNVLLTSIDPSSPTIAKITDYGISTLASPSGVPGASGSPGYSAPEVVSLKVGGKGGQHDLFPYSVKCDIYSFGLVLHELAVGRSPWVDYVYEEHFSDKGTNFSSNPPDEIILKGILPSPLSSYEGATVWPCAEELIKKCLQRNPEERPTSCQVFSVLTDVQSSCLKLSVSLLSPGPTIARIYQNNETISKSSGFMRSFSLSPEKLIMTAELSGSHITDIYYYDNPLYHEPTGSESSCIMQAIINNEKGRIISDEVYVQLESGISINCMIRLPDSYSPKTVVNRKQLQHSHSQQGHFCGPMLIAGTSQGHLLIVSSGSYFVKHHFSCGFTALHFHQPVVPDKQQDYSGSCYILVALKDLTFHVFTMEQIQSTSKHHPLHSLNFSNLSSGNIAWMTSVGKTVHVACEKKITSLTLADSGPPFVLGTVDVESPLVAFATGLDLFYAGTQGKTHVATWAHGEPIIKLNVAVGIFQCTRDKFLPRVTVTALFIDVKRSCLWVGVSNGQIVVFAEPHHKALAVLHRHTGPIHQIFDIKGLSSDKDFVACLGEGSRSTSEDFKQAEDDCIMCQDELDGAFRPRHTSASTFFHLTIWDADLPKKSASLKSLLKLRKTL